MSNPTLALGSPTLADRVLTRGLVTDAALISAGAVLTAGAAQLAVPLWPVPITGQTLAVLVVGCTLGATRGALSMVLYAVLGLIGLPVFSDGASGVSVIAGPTGGYIVGFIFAAGFIGWMAEHGADRNVVLAFLAFVGGQLIIFAFGLVGLKLAVDESWGWTIHNGFTIFIVGGLVKAAIGAAVLPSAWGLVRRFER
jgi:biotin transport system substrate-specific component